MNLYEHQAKRVFAEAGIPVPRGALAAAPEEVAAAVAQVGAPCVLKAQVLRGGRGKAGLIQAADSAAEAVAKGRALFAAAPDVKAVLVEERLRIERELYLAFTIEPCRAGVTAMASAAGGVEIEAAAARAPGAVVAEPIDLCHGLMPFNVRNLTAPLGLSPEAAKAFGQAAGRLYGVLRARDATLAEINPLVQTPDGACVAADARLTLDDHALYRQPFERSREEFVNRIEYEAAGAGIPYVQLDGDIGLMCAGAGLTSTVADLIHDFGGRPANFLEFGGPNYRKAREAMRLTLLNRPKVVLIVTFGTIARADVMAEGIAEALAELKPAVPIVTAIRGTGEERAAEILRAAGLEPLQDTEEAVRRAVALAGGGSR